MVNVGKKQGFFPGNLMELINRGVVGTKPEVGRIDLLPDYTLFDVRKEDAHRVIDALRNADFFGTRVRAEVATDRDYALEARDRREKKRHREERASFGSGKEGRKGDRKSGSGKEKKAKKEKKSKKADKPGKRPDYNGNYDIFIKKKK